MERWSRGDKIAGVSLLLTFVGVVAAVVVVPEFRTFIGIEKPTATAENRRESKLKDSSNDKREAVEQVHEAERKPLPSKQVARLNGQETKVTNSPPPSTETSDSPTNTPSSVGA